MIRHIFRVSLFFLFLIQVSICNGQNSISGEIKGLPAGHLQLILEEDINRKKSRLIAKIPIDHKGKFHFRGKLSPNIYSLVINDNSNIMLAIDKGQKIIIKGTGEQVSSWQVSGSEDTRALIEYESFRSASLARLVNPVRKAIKELKQKGVLDDDPALMELSKLEVENYTLHRDELIRYIENKMGTSLAIYPTSVRWSGENNLTFLSALAQDFENAHPGTDISKKIKEKVAVLKANSIGGKVADIKMPDKDGRNISLFPIQAKYVLIDFWASWCAPCRRESPGLNDLYKKYNQAGFEIYGVSLDHGKEVWLRAVEKDKRAWINVSTLQGFETPVSFDYAVTSLPSNVLVDQKGVVIAKDLHGDELRKVIDELFAIGQ